jgi:hypothetical protein
MFCSAAGAHAGVLGGANASIGNVNGQVPAEDQSIFSLKYFIA